MLIKAIETALKKSCLHPELLEVMDYAVIPAGKLFRPKLVQALSLDLSSELTPNHLHLACAIELHHAYTLIHDDLPSMDNDLIRRGKPATHVQFGEWKAVLGGDALLVASFRELSEIEHESFQKILKLMTWATGAKGLIEGQFRDLSAHTKLNIRDVIRIHELKTARLIQLATLGTYLLSKQGNLKENMEFLRLGREIGVSFQLLDDLSELTSPDVSHHEKEINPFIYSPHEALKFLSLSHQKLGSIVSKHNLKNVNLMLDEYFKSNQEVLLNNFLILEKNISSDISSLKNWITNFA